MDYTNNTSNKLLVFIFIFIILFFCSIINKPYDFNTISYKDNNENKNITIYTKQQIRELYIDKQINDIVNTIIFTNPATPYINRYIKLFPTKNSKYIDLEKKCIRITNRLSNIFIDSLVTGKIVNKHGAVQIGYKIYNKPFNYNNKYYCSVTIDWS
jgi:hypothetical protein